MSVEILENIGQLRAWRTGLLQQGKTLSFVPTMGALHEGHLSLVRAGQKKSDICLPYIFLNPKQFAQGEDLGKYPKTLERDLSLLEEEGIGYVYVPSTEEIYPPDFQTHIQAGSVAAPLEGECRPQFFSGVCTIVCKMLLQALPDTAIFGEKDWQQLQVIKQMVRDLNIPVRIESGPIIRDENGLALSSRNAYLSPEDYNIALSLPQVLQDFAKGKMSEGKAVQTLLNKGFDKVDYFTARNGITLTPENPDRVLAASWLNGTRLIDNMPAEI